MKIESIAGFAAITQDPAAAHRLYQGLLGLPLKEKDGYLYTDHIDGAKHFGAWPLAQAAQACFGTDTWPSEVPTPHATLEFELADIASVEAAVEEMKAAGQQFIHETRTEPWGQTLARFITPEGLLIGLSYAPWLHEPR